MPTYRTRELGYKHVLGITIKKDFLPYHKKDIDTLERIQRRAPKITPELRDLSYEERLKECGLITLEAKRRSD